MHLTFVNNVFLFSKSKMLFCVRKCEKILKKSIFQCPVRFANLHRLKSVSSFGGLPVYIFQKLFIMIQSYMQKLFNIGRTLNKIFDLMQFPNYYTVRKSLLYILHKAGFKILKMSSINQLYNYHKHSATQNIIQFGLQVTHPLSPFPFPPCICSYLRETTDDGERQGQ